MNKMKKFINDIFGDSVKIWDHEDHPECEQCNIWGRKPRKAKLKYSILKALKSKNPFQTTKVDPLTHSKLIQPRPPGMPNGHVYVCNACYNSYLTEKRKKDNTLQLV
jgi:hypothetical protein